MQDIVHQCLERSLRICEAGWHDRELKVSLMGTKGCFLNIFWMHANFMVATSKINLGEEPCSTQFIKQFINNGDRKFVLDSLVIQSAVVNIKSSRAVQFLDEQDRR
jgi:hypothetical protein